MEAGREAGRGRLVIVLESSALGSSEVNQALAEQNRVVALELPGFGDSPVNAESKSVKDLAATAAQAIEKLLAEQQYTLIGASFAADVALWQALETPEKVEALILISPTAILPRGGASASRPDQTDRRSLTVPEKTQELPPLDPAIAAKEQELALRLRGVARESAVETMLSGIRCPTLVVFGVEDTMVAPEAARIYREKIPNCNVSFVYDAGHDIAAERPEALINAVVDFVERREAFVVARRSNIINP